MTDEQGGVTNAPETYDTTINYAIGYGDVLTPGSLPRVSGAVSNDVALACHCGAKLAIG